MKALGYYVVIMETKDEVQTTKGGLLLTDKHKEDIRFKKGIVCSVGTEVNTLNEGDIVLYDKHAGNYLEHDKKVFKVIKAPDISVVL